MEREKRKKMLPEEENGGGVGEETKKKKRRRRRKEERERTPAAAAAEVKMEMEMEEPTTEEVEEFYAILRRMDVALRYLKGAEKRLVERRTTEVVRIGEDGENKELNLNEVPTDSTN